MGSSMLRALKERGCSFEDSEQVVPSLANEIGGVLGAAMISLTMLSRFLKRFCMLTAGFLRVAGSGMRHCSALPFFTH